MLIHKSQTETCAIAKELLATHQRMLDLAGKVPFEEKKQLLNAGNDVLNACLALEKLLHASVHQ
jgi:hypothetical protein